MKLANRMFGTRYNVAPRNGITDVGRACGFGFEKEGVMEDRSIIPRGADLTDDDLRLIVDDFYVVRNWAALQMRKGPDVIKEQCFRALQVRLGRRELVIDAPLDALGALAMKTTEGKM